MAKSSKTKRAKSQPPNRQLLDTWTERQVTTWTDRLLTNIEMRAAWGYHDPIYVIPRLEWLNGQIPGSTVAAELRFFHAMIMAWGHRGWRIALDFSISSGYRPTSSSQSFHNAVTVLRRVLDATPAVGRVSTATGDIHIVHPPQLQGRIYPRSLCLRIHSEPNVDGLVVGFAPEDPDDDTFLLPCPVSRTVWLDTHIASSRRWLEGCRDPQEMAVNYVFMTSKNVGSWYDWQSQLIHSAMTADLRPSRHLPDVIRFVDDNQRHTLVASLLRLAQPSPHRIARDLVVDWSLSIMMHVTPRMHYRYAMASPAELGQMNHWYGQVLREMLSRLGVSTPLPAYDDTPCAITWVRLDETITLLADAWEFVTTLRPSGASLPFAASSIERNTWVAQPRAYMMLEHVPPVLDLWKALAAMAPEPPAADGSRLSRRARSIVTALTELPGDGPIDVALLPDEQTLANTRGVGPTTLEDIRGWLCAEFHRWRGHVAAMADRERPSAQLNEALGDLLDVFADE